MKLTALVTQRLLMLVNPILRSESSLACSYDLSNVAYAVI